MNADTDDKILANLKRMGFTETDSVACDELIDITFNGLSSWTKVVAERHGVDPRKLWRMFFYLNLNAINELDQAKGGAA